MQLSRCCQGRLLDHQDFRVLNVNRRRKTPAGGPYDQCVRIIDLLLDVNSAFGLTDVFTHLCTSVPRATPESACSTSKSSFDEKIVSMYARGMSTREITAICTSCMASTSHPT